jgi:hypothetical protein
MLFYSKKNQTHSTCRGTPYVILILLCCGEQPKKDKIKIVGILSVLWPSFHRK